MMELENYLKWAPISKRIFIFNSFIVYIYNIIINKKGG